MTIRPTLLNVLALLSACATARPAPLPTLPPPIDLGSLLPPAPPPLAVPPATRRYDDKAIRAGQCGPGAPPGILVSPAVYAETLAGLSDAKRLRVEVGALSDLRKTERQAALDLEQACRVHAAELADQVARAERLSGWKTGAVFVVGGLIGLVAGSILASRPVAR